jgi:hypothetical protein
LALVANIVALQAADFVGVLQYPFAHVIWRLLTFVTAASNWLSFMPCAFLSLIFFDTAPRDCRGAERIERERVINRLFVVAGPAVCVVALVLNFAIGAGYGFGSTEARPSESSPPSSGQSSTPRSSSQRAGCAARATCR